MSSEDFEGPRAEPARTDRHDRSAAADQEASDRSVTGHAATDRSTTDPSPTTHPPTNEVTTYASEVRAQFTDLPAADSTDLLEDLEDHLTEVAAEDAGTLRERLGEPAAYARELRQAAGLPEPGDATSPGTPGAPGTPGTQPPRPRRRKLRVLARDTATDLDHWARQYRAGREVLDFLPTLRPAWWVLRAWVAVRLLEVFTTTRSPWQYFSLIPQVGDSSFVGLVALLVAIPASVYAARRTVPAGWRRRAMGAGEGILVLFTVGMALSALGDHGGYGDTPSQASYIQQSQQGFSTPDGQPLTNLYVYDQTGKLLNGVLVYDQDGRPLDLSMTPYSDGPFANDGWLDGNGALVTNIFPRRTLQPQWNSADGQTHYVAVPPPAVTIPQGLHRDTGPGDPAPSSPSSQGSQNSQNSPTANPSTTTAVTPGAQTPTTLPSTPTTLPSTPTPPAATR